MPPTNRTYKGAKSKAKRQQAFIMAFMDCASIVKACKKSKVPRQTVYDWFEADDKFREAFDKASIAALGVLEDEAVRRAYEGTLKPVYQSGRLVGKVREFSDQLLIILLKARAPQKYKDRFAGELTGKDGAPLNLPAPQINVYTSGPPLASSESEIQE
jgi:hypothetical protein